MMSGKDGVGQIIKAFVTVVTLIALTGRLRVIKAALDDLVGLTRWAGDTIWPAQLTDGLITLDIIDEILDIDLHGGLLSEIVEWDGVSIHHPQIHDPGIQYEPVWKAPTLSALVRLLHNPTYAGVYVYGQCAYDAFERSETTGKAKPRVRPIEEWPVCVHEAFPAYLSWEQFQRNQQVLRANWYRSSSRGAPRKGAALLQGIAFCGHCGRKMGLQHYATREKRAPAYVCYQAYQNEGSPTCQCMSAKGVDEAITTLFLAAMTPAKVDLAMGALEELERDRAATRQQWTLQLQQADYEVQLAQRRYETVDPAYRLVAGELEMQWEAALKQRDTLQRRYVAFERQQERDLGPKEYALMQKLAGEMEHVWLAETTTMADRKTLLRYLIKRVHLDGVREQGKIHLDVEWHTGAHTALTIDRALVGAWAPRTPAAVEHRIQELMPDHTQAQIAQVLNAEGFRSAHGKPFKYRTVRYIIQSRDWDKQETVG
jgi:Recombinase zinc beta ribbon domain/Recombinase